MMGTVEEKGEEDIPIGSLSCNLFSRKTVSVGLPVFWCTGRGDISKETMSWPHMAGHMKINVLILLKGHRKPTCVLGTKLSCLGMTHRHLSLISVVCTQRELNSDILKALGLFLDTLKSNSYKRRNMRTVVFYSFSLSLNFLFLK